MDSSTLKEIVGMASDNDEHIRLWCSMALFHEQCVFVSYMMSVGLLY